MSNNSNHVGKINNFHQVAHNLAKAGAYYTDKYNVNLIRGLIDLPEDEFTVLEPCIGDASAVECLLAEFKQFCILYGVELSKTTYEALREKEYCDYLLNGDFLNTRITNKAFDLVFGNPPYMDSELERCETVFLRRIFPLMRPGGILIWIIPAYLTSNEENHATVLANRFSIEQVYKFHEPEFSKFKQIVLICRRKERLVRDKAAAERIRALTGNVEELEEIPEVFEGKKSKIVSKKHMVKEFDLKDFSPTIAKIVFSRMGRINHHTEQMMRLSNRSRDTLKSIMPLKSDFKYLTSAVGYSKGVIEAENQTHLFLSKVYEQVDRIYVSNGDSNEVIERKSHGNKTIITTDHGIIELGVSNENPHQ